MTDASYPVERLALQRTVRLVSTARLRDPVLRRLVDPEHFNDLAEIEGATSGRLMSKRGGSDGIGADEFVGSHPHATFINAAFAYFRPQELNRFNGPGRGAWYAALTTGTCLKEVIWHITRELDRVRDYQAVVEYTEMFASFAGEFIDLRGVAPAPQCLDPDPEVGYPDGNALADHARALGHNGIIYPSVRDPIGTCLVALWPHAVQSVSQGAILRVFWSGQPTPTVSQVSG